MPEGTTSFFLFLGGFLFWFIYGVFYSSLRREAIKLAIFEYNNTSKNRPLLIWLFFTLKALNKENIYCYNYHYDGSCDSRNHNRNDNYWMDYQPDNCVAAGSLIITIFRLTGLVFYFSFLLILWPIAALYDKILEVATKVVP